MPTAKLTDILGPIKEPERRVTGTANIPLNAEGRKQGVRLARRIRGEFDQVRSSPMGRDKETANMISHEVATEPDLGPMKLGAHEGKPVETERQPIHDRMINRPDEVAPGVSKQSGKRGESMNQFADRMIGLVQDEEKELEENPELKILNVTHGRNMRLIEAWAMAGFPEDRSVDMEEMTRDGDDWSKPAELFRLGKTGLEKVDGKPKEPGIYFVRHGETDFSKTSTSARSEPNPANRAQGAEPQPAETVAQ